MSDTAIKIENLKKRYRLGAIGGGTLNADLQSWWARKRHKEDPNLKIGESYDQQGDTFWALKGINLEVKKGEALGIIGANGAGKSTLLKILSRVTAPTEGDVWINGRISSMLEVGTGFHGELTGRENIYMNGAILGMSRKEIDEKIESIIDFSECRQFIDTPVKRYSSGMYVKLAFAVASHLDAEILIMDEVLAVGDVQFQKKCLERMRNISNQSGKTILYVSHNMESIRRLCTKCTVLENGKLQYWGETEKAIDTYLNAPSAHSLPTSYSFIGLNRRDESLGKNVFINTASIIESGNNVSDDTIFELSWNNKLAISDYYYRIVIKDNFDSLVGMTETDIISNAFPGHHISRIFFPHSRLSDGLYAAIISINTEFGSKDYAMLDEAPLPVFFQIYENRHVKNHYYEWLSGSWGHVWFTRMKHEEIQERRI